MDRGSPPDLERIRSLAAELAATGTGPAADLAVALAEAVTGLSDRVDALWQLISAVVESAGLTSAATGPAEAPPPAPAGFAQELAGARNTGRRGIRLSIDGQDWVAALGSLPPAAGPETWTALERLARQNSPEPDRDGPG